MKQEENNSREKVVGEKYGVEAEEWRSYSQFHFGENLPSVQMFSQVTQ